VQVVGHHDAHRVDVVGLGDGLPGRFGALEAVALRGVRRELAVDVGYRDQPDRGRGVPNTVCAVR
jgi:hypothetical protein